MSTRATNDLPCCLYAYQDRVMAATAQYLLTQLQALNCEIDLPANDVVRLRDSRAIVLNGATYYTRQITEENLHTEVDIFLRRWPDGLDGYYVENNRIVLVSLPGPHSLYSAGE